MRLVYFKKNLIIIAISLGVLSGCQGSGQQAEEREKFGIELFQQGEYDKAKLEFKSALKQDGTLANTYYYLALLNEKNRSYKAMKENLIHAVEFAPENIKARIKLGKIYLLFDDLDEALIEADEISMRSEDTFDGLALKAAVLIKQKKQGDALVIIEDILQKQPDYLEAITLKTLILMQNEQFETASMVINPLIESGVDDISLQMLKIQLDTKRNNIDAVIVDYERLCQLYPEKQAFKFALAKIYSQANKKDLAEKVLRQVITSAPLAIQPKIVLLEFLNSIGKEKAMEQLKTFTAENQDKPDLLFKMSQWLISKQFFSEAKTLLVKIDSLVNDNDLKQKQQVKLFLAKVHFHSKEIEKSKAIVDELIAENTENQQVKILRAMIYMAQEKFDEAEALLIKVLWVDPNSDESLVLLGSIELLRGFPEKADKKFREALKVNPVNKKALILVMNRSLKNKNIDYASELLTRALKLQPNNIELLKAAVEIKMVSRNWDGSKKVLETLETQSNGSLLAKFLTARLHQEQGEFSQAVTIYKEVLAADPDYPDVLRQMATCYEVMRKRSEMLGFMTSFVENNPKNISAYLIMGELHSLNKDSEKAVYTYDKALTINKKIPQVYAALARLYSQQGDNKKAVEIYQKGIEEIPGNVRLSIYLASVYEANEEYKKAEEIYESLLLANPRLDIAINNYTSMLADKYGDKQSLEKARKLLVRFGHSENPFYLDSFAWVEFKLGNVKVALPVLEKVNILSDLAVFKYHLGVAYYKQGNNAAAAAQLLQAVNLGKQKGVFVGFKHAQQLLDELTITDEL